MSTYANCYEASRIYRNAVVGIARQKLSALGPSWAQALHRAFGDTWEKLVADAEERRSSGELSTKIVDDLDYLGVNQFLILFEAHFDVLFPPRQGADERSRRSEKQAIMGWAREVRALRDPVMHPSEQDLSYNDAFRMVDSGRRILRQLGVAEAADELQAILEAISGAPVQTSMAPLEEEPLEGYLPPAEAPIRFVGRDHQLQALHEWLTVGRHARWAVTGAGGVGKSAVAYQFAQEVRDRRTRPFEFVFWLSAKRRRFVEGAVVEVPQPDFSDLASAVDFLLFRYGEFHREAPTLDERIQLLLRLLNDFPALIVADDIDSLEGEQEAAIEFLTIQAPSTKSRVLVTSRRQPFGFGGTTTEVPGFVDEDGAVFVLSRAMLYGLDEAAFTKPALREIVRATDGAPLYIDELLRLCVTGVAPRDAAREWKRHGQSARRYALGREIELLDEAARDVLLAACVPDGSASRAELEAVTGLGADEIESALRQLQRLFLVPKPRFIESEARFELNQNTKSLVRELHAGSDALRKAEGGFRALSDDPMSSVARRSRVGGYISQAVALVRQDRHPEAEATLRSGLEAYPNDPDLLAQLAWVFRRWKPQPRITDARETFQRAHQLQCRNEQMYRHWADMEAQEEAWSSSAEAAEAGLAHRPDSSLLRAAAGYARSRLARDLISQLQPRGEEELNRAWDHLRQAVRDPAELLDFNDRRTQSRVFRSLLVTAEMMLRTLSGSRESNPRAARRAHAIASEALDYLERWRAEHPDDPNVGSEGDRLEPRIRAILSNEDPRR